MTEPHDTTEDVHDNTYRGMHRRNSAQTNIFALTGALRVLADQPGCDEVSALIVTQLVTEWDALAPDAYGTVKRLWCTDADSPRRYLYYHCNGLLQAYGNKRHEFELVLPAWSAWPALREEPKQRPLLVLRNEEFKPTYRYHLYKGKQPPPYPVDLEQHALVQLQLLELTDDRLRRMLVNKSNEREARDLLWCVHYRSGENKYGTRYHLTAAGYARLRAALRRVPYESSGEGVWRIETVLKALAKEPGYVHELPCLSANTDFRYNYHHNFKPTQRLSVLYAWQLALRECHPDVQDYARWCGWWVSEEVLARVAGVCRATVGASS